MTETLNSVVTTSPPRLSQVTVPHEVYALSTSVGVERVFAVGGRHGSCNSFALSQSASDVHDRISSENGRPARSTPDAYAEWRVLRSNEGGEWIATIELYDGSCAPAPGFDLRLVPDTARCIIVVTERYSPVVTEMNSPTGASGPARWSLHWFRNRIKR